MTATRMAIRRKRRYPGPGGMMVCSLLLHLALLIVVVTFRLYPEAHPLEEATYYVDMISLPVASPAPGDQAATVAPAAKPQPAAAAPAPAKPAPKAPQAKPAPAKVAPAAPATAAPSEMSYPSAKNKQPGAKKQTAQAQKSQPEAQTGPAQGQKGKSPTPSEAQSSTAKDEERAFAEKMAKLERKAEEGRQAAALAKLARMARNNGGKVGPANGAGTESGADYKAFVVSRIQDAFYKTSSAEAKAPVVQIRFTIGGDGRIAQSRMEQSSGDRLFEDAALRALRVAEKTFGRPPKGTPQELTIRFRIEKQGVVEIR